MKGEFWENMASSERSPEVLPMGLEFQGLASQKALYLYSSVPKYFHHSAKLLSARHLEGVYDYGAPMAGMTKQQSFSCI